MIIRKFTFKWRTLKFLFTKRNSCKEGKARVRLFKSHDCHYSEKHEFREVQFEFIYKWPCNCNNGWNKPYCLELEGFNSSEDCIPEWERREIDNHRTFFDELNGYSFCNGCAKQLDINTDLDHVKEITGEEIKCYFCWELM